jgi:tellurite resistance protein
MATADFASLVGFFDLTDGPRIAKRDAIAIVQLLAKLGVGLEPDPRFTPEVLEREGKCILFQAEGVLPATPTEAYKTASLMMRLAATVMSSDGSVASGENEVLERHIESVLGFLPCERQRLAAHVRWCMLSAPELTGLKKRLLAWSKPQRQSAARIMLLVANADNLIAPAEVTVLTKIYRLLELNPETLFSDLHAIQTHPAELPPTILHPDHEPSGRRIPRQSTSRKRAKSAAVPLDVEVIERTIRETQQVQQLLASVFTDDEVRMPDKSAAIDPATASVLGLDSTHSTLLVRLLAKPDWPRPDFEALCAEYQVLPDGAIETINTAAMEHHGDMLFEMRDSLQLNQDVAKEVQA